MFYWKDMKYDVETSISQCAICQQAKHLQSRLAGLLQPLPMAEGVRNELSTDFIEGLPKNDGYSVILVMMERLTKYARFFPLKHSYSALFVARILYDGVMKLHGMPESIVSNRDKVFTSTVWTELFKLMGLKLLYNTTYHPQIDGKTKHVNQFLKMYLCCAIWGVLGWGKLSCGIILISILHWVAPLSRPCMDMSLIWELVHQCQKMIFL
jgi:hypothetical protein